MKKQVLIGLTVFLVVGCSNNNITPSPIVKNVENRTVVSSSKKEEPKKILIDLDKEIKDDGLKGGVFETIRGLIPMGNNDEVSFSGEKLFIATNIKLYINGKLKATIKSAKGIFTIKGSEVNDGDKIVITNRFKKKLIEKEIVKK